MWPLVSRLVCVPPCVLPVCVCGPLCYAWCSHVCGALCPTWCVVCSHELKVDSWEDVPFSNEAALAQAVSQTPVIVAICAGPALDDWHHYTGGCLCLVDTVAAFAWCGDKQLSQS